MGSFIPLVWFGGEKAHPKGIIELSLTFGEESKVVTKMLSFLVVDFTSMYNAILERLTLHELKAILSTYHQLMKFPTPRGVGIVKSK